VIGSVLMRRFARAIDAAWATTFAISSFVTWLLLANPQVPSTMTRTPKP
jgi:hypothetical protein